MSSRRAPVTMHEAADCRPRRVAVTERSRVGVDLDAVVQVGAGQRRDAATQATRATMMRPAGAAGDVDSGSCADVSPSGPPLRCGAWSCWGTSGQRGVDVHLLSEAEVGAFIAPGG